MKVIHLMGTLRPSGMERMFISAAKYFADSECDSIIVGQGDMHTFIPTLTEAGYRVEIIKSLRSFAGIAMWMRLLRSERPDVIHIHTEGAFAFSVLSASLVLPKAPIIRTIHNVFTPTGRARVSRLIQAWLADFAVATFIAVSPDVQRNEVSFNRSSRLILNWVDDKFFLSRPARSNPIDDVPAAIIVGNASPIKNHLLALKAILSSEYSVYYHGDESGASAEETAILDSLEAAGRVRYRGVGDPTQSLSKASVFLLPSKHEGMPIALSEALVMGLPAIINDVPGVQWARDFPHVVVVRGGEEEWNRALRDISQVGADVVDAELPLDLSARRGVQELVSEYRLVLPRVNARTA